MSKYVPPFNRLCQALGIAPEALDKLGEISVPAPILKHLIRLMLAELQVDVNLYLEENPDLATGLSSRSRVEIAKHFRSTGYFEGRMLPVALDVDYYVNRYQDVQSALTSKTLDSPQRHYRDQGASEMRAPRKEFEAEIAVWSEVLLRPR